MADLELHPLDEHSDVWRAGYEEGIKRALTYKGIPTGGDTGYDVSTVKLLRFALQDLPPHTEVMDPYGMPLRGEVADNYSFGKSLFLYGRRLRPTNLGEPF